MAGPMVKKSDFFLPGHPHFPHHGKEFVHFGKELVHFVREFVHYGEMRLAPSRKNLE